jgi:hypothetical protein
MYIGEKGGRQSTRKAIMKISCSMTTTFTSFSSKMRKCAALPLALLICMTFALSLLADDAGSLIDAAIAGDLPTIKMLLDKGANVNSKATDGSTPLIYAAQNGRISVMETLLKKGADVNLPNNGGSTAIGLASFMGDTNIVKMLLEKGAKVDKADANGKTSIFYASLAGNDEIVRMLIAHGANDQEKTERSKFIVKGVVKKIDTTNNVFAVKVTDGAVVGSGDETVFGIADGAHVYGGVTAAHGVGHLKLNDRVLVYYSGKMTVNGFNFATATGSGSGFSYTASVISILSN